METANTIGEPVRSRQDKMYLDGDTLVIEKQRTQYSYGYANLTGFKKRYLVAKSITTIRYWLPLLDRTNGPLC